MVSNHRDRKHWITASAEATASNSLLQFYTHHTHNIGLPTLSFLLCVIGMLDSKEVGVRVSVRVLACVYVSMCDLHTLSGSKGSQCSPASHKGLVSMATLVWFAQIVVRCSPAIKTPGNHTTPKMQNMVSPYVHREAVMCLRACVLLDDFVIINSSKLNMFCLDSWCVHVIHVP